MNHPSPAPADFERPLRRFGDVLDFWFGYAVADVDEARERNRLWFQPDPAMDAQVERFSGLMEDAAEGDLSEWLDHPRSCLALVILLDQFPRNLYRGTARAFEHDSLALHTARVTIEGGGLDHLWPIEQAFLVMPYEHSESVVVQLQSVALFEEILNRAPADWQPLMQEYLQWARRHLEIVQRFGRFPHRNAALGRVSSPAELEYLSSSGESFGQAVAEPS